MTHAPFRKFLRIGAALIVSAAVGCHKKGIDSNIGSMAGAPSTTTGPAPTASLTADPLAIDLGQSIVLNWRTRDAETATIDGIGDVPVNGTQTVSPANSTNFHLIAKGPGGTTEASVRVTVRVPVAPTVPAADASANTDTAMGSEEAFHKNVQDIFFSYDSYDLDADAQANAAHAAAYLASHPAIKIVIGGYCDERGSAEYNLALGENRANAARAALTGAGVASSRIRVVSFGKEKQFCTTQDETCYQQNRRAQFSLDR
jgi:peptidoglycan-associated lipoprotein